MTWQRTSLRSDAVFITVNGTLSVWLQTQIWIQIPMISPTEGWKQVFQTLNSKSIFWSFQICTCHPPPSLTWWSHTDDGPKPNHSGFCRIYKSSWDPAARPWQVCLCIFLHFEKSEPYIGVAQDIKYRQTNRETESYESMARALPVASLQAQFLIDKF